MLEKNYTEKIVPSEQGACMPYCITEIGSRDVEGYVYSENKQMGKYVILYCMRGSGAVCYRDVRYCMSANELVLLDGNELGYIEAGRDEGWCWGYIEFTSHYGGVFEQAINGEALTCVRYGENEEIRRSLWSINQSRKEAGASQDILRSMFVNDLLTYVLLQAQSEKKMDGLTFGRQVISDAAAYISSNYHERISVDTMAFNAHVSKFYFIKLFKKHVGISPYQYLIQCRIKEAKRLLEGSEASISNIALSVGFYDECSFIKKFKASTGVTPLVYRKLFNDKHKNGIDDT